MDCAFCCLPHATTQDIIKALPESLKIVDLSADFRLRNVDTYAEWYGGEHRAPELQCEAVYGLVELNREAVKSARLVANPGCYPTAAQLPLIPLLSKGVILPDDIIIDAKSGTTGAGRAPKQGTLFCEVADGIHAYGVASHRHAPEIEQGLADAAGKPVIINFTPHLMPMSRGILESIYVKLAPGKTAADAKEVSICLHAPVCQGGQDMTRAPPSLPRFLSRPMQMKSSSPFWRRATCHRLATCEEATTSL